MLGDSTLANVYAQKLKPEIAFQAHSLASSIRRQAIAQRYHRLIDSLTELQCRLLPDCFRLPPLAHFAHSTSTSFSSNHNLTQHHHHCLLNDTLFSPVLISQLSHRSEKKSGQLTARPLPVQTGDGPGYSRGSSPPR